MLNAQARCRALVPVERLAPRPRAAAGTAAPIDWTTPIDRTRAFFCDTLTPLAYTRVYDALEPHHRLRYNQLTGMFSNELIRLLETSFLTASLRVVEREAGEDLAPAVAAFAADERRHGDTWRRLNRLSAPEWYTTHDNVFCQPSSALSLLARVIARHPTVWPVMFWIQLSQEERSIEVSRRCLRVPADRMEPRYAATYREHLHDEVRHVQIDCHLIERFYARRSAAVRRLTAAIFRALVVSVFLRPVRSSVRIVRVLASEYPELAPLVPRMTTELGAVAANGDYQRMMYSRETTPLTFEWFDRFEEFRSMSRVLGTYAPCAAGR